MLKVGCICIGYPNFRYDVARGNFHKVLEYLEQQELELYSNTEVLITEDDIEVALDEMSKKNIDLFVLAIGTYSYGSALMQYLEKIKGAHLLLWAFREPILEGFTGLPLNSLCGLNMYTSFLKRMGKTDFSYLYGGAEELGTRKQLSAILHAAQIKKELRNARFCIVGGRVPGFYLSNVDELRFREAIGPELVYYSLACLLEDAKELPQEIVDAEVKKTASLVNTCTASGKSQQSSARIYLALRNYARRNGISGFALKCWPDFQELMEVAVCGVVSRLNQEGLLTSCEGDVTGLATMFMQSRMTADPVFLTDLVNITEDGTVKLWHCGSASPALAADAAQTTYESHPTMKHIDGMAARLDLKPGCVLLCKLSEDTPYKLLAAEGDCICPDRVLDGNQGDIRIKGDGRKLLELIVEEGIEHHYSIGYGCDLEVMKRLAGMMGIRLVSIG